ncbi:Z1 domain-containing protein [Rhodobacteraceae bacterium]|nr:Z1 domain-containing protein [Paracoccaceae bacterium]
MNEAIETVRNMVEMGLFNQPRKTEGELRLMIRGVADAIEPSLSDAEIEHIAREIEHKQGIKAGLGAVVDSEDFEPWLDDAKQSIKPFYWDRYQRFLLHNGLPKDVVISTDVVTDKILSRLGNPQKHEAWDRRGMVVGHVQSGKTANYTGLICKAADAGYRLIIIIAGIHNNLRNQTQERIDEGFIGRDTGKSKEAKKGGAKHIIGVGHFDPNNTPVSLTNTLRDFNKATASTNTSEIDSYKVPVVLVIKKQSNTLTNLLQWLRDNSARGDNEMIDQPMLLIDDEADNASINTKYNNEDVTTTNKLIRKLLNTFHRSCYVGYTATPFANIFIDPDQDDGMLAEDLFPKDFIIGLDAPSNYFGGKKVFIEGLPDDENPTWLRYVDDNEDVLPIKHPQDFVVETLPNSLVTAVRAFVLTATIRMLKNQEHKHCSMLVNASFRNPVQLQLRNRLHEVLQRIQNAVRVNGSAGGKGIADPEIAALKEVWEREFKMDYSSWEEIQVMLHDAIAAAQVVLVNYKSKDVLEYPDEIRGKAGKKYISVGGFSLSRGLTLEGLTVTWFLRNTKMYDTLMQMGRWFGYRTGYEKLCRIWMPAEAIGWYAYIANATEELHSEIHDMAAVPTATPKDFGLAVRSHPASLLVTARNKMGSGTKVTTLVGLSNKFVETSRVSIREGDLFANKDAAKSLFLSIKNAGLEGERSSWGTLYRDVPVQIIDRFLAAWRNADQSVTTNPEPVRKYIDARSSDELQTWDVLVPSLTKGKANETLGTPIVPAERYVDLEDLQHGFMSFSGKRMRVASRGIEKAGVDPVRAEAAEARYKEKNGKADGERVNYPDSIYRRERNRGLFVLHFVKAKRPDGKEDGKQVDLIPAEPVVAWGISLPVSSRPAERVEYVVNSVRYRELFGDEDIDEEQEAALENS